MGRTGKTTTPTIKGQSDKDTTKECVSEDTISKLMKDFTCASLLTKATQSTAKDKRSYVKEAHASCCEEIVSSLKHFHLKTPVNKRTRLKEKKDFQRRARSALENKYNLAVAAINSQSSVLWPGRLHCLSNERTESSSDVIIRPSRLSIPGITDTIKPPSKSSLSSLIQNSSSEEKARIAASLTGHNVPQFGAFKESNGSNTLCFSQLCNSDSKNLKTKMGDFLLNSHALPASIKTQDYRHCPVVVPKHKGSEENSLNLNHSCKNSKNEMPPHINSSQQQQEQRALPHSHTHSEFVSSHSVGAGVMNNVNNVIRETEFPVLPSNTSHSLLANVASTDSPIPERSCSGEMRMEESNVNELASYFEDLLHIPRKMSVMAEMMYA